MKTDQNFFSEMVIEVLFSRLPLVVKDVNYFDLESYTDAKREQRLDIDDDTFYRSLLSELLVNKPYTVDMMEAGLSLPKWLAVSRSFQYRLDAAIAQKKADINKIKTELYKTTESPRLKEIFKPGYFDLCIELLQDIDIVDENQSVVATVKSKLNPLVSALKLYSEKILTSNAFNENNILMYINEYLSGLKQASGKPFRGNTKWAARGKEYENLCAKLKNKINRRLSRN